MTPEPPAPSARKYHRIGKYEVLARIAGGGMGVVYRARDEETGREVALKVLAPTLLATNPVALKRFRREAGRGEKLRHENLVSIYEFGQANDTYFLALEYVDGIDLHEYITRKERLDPAEACRLLTQAAQALDYLHGQQMVHRDVKPANFLVTEAGGEVTVKLTDLGLAREVTDQESRVTRAGNTVGTIDYMAPEQARDSSTADIRSDLYSLGCTFYHMLAGHPPFPEGGLTERLYKHAEAEPADVRQFNPKVQATLAAILQRLLAKQPRDRYQTPAELLADLARYSRGEALLTATRLTATALAALSSERLGDTKPVAPAAQDQVTRYSVAAYPTPPPAPLSSTESNPLAARQFDHAQDAIAQKNYDYALHLLLSCCKLEPTNLAYRQALRHAQRLQEPTGDRAGLAGHIRRWLATARLKMAQRGGDHWKVLEYGEAVLSREPTHIGTQIDMASAADQLGLPHVATWILEHAWQKETHTPALNRALARQYEKQGAYMEAAALWKLVLQAEPADPEAHRQINDLAARATIARGNYQELVSERGTKESP
jgi:serine/threonine protein kinase